jgi:hypothetical protein
LRTIEKTSSIPHILGDAISATSDWQPMEIQFQMDFPRQVWIVTITSPKSASVIF